jgi:hypothetical protein
MARYPISVRRRVHAMVVASSEAPQAVFRGRAARRPAQVPRGRIAPAASPWHTPHPTTSRVPTEPSGSGWSFIPATAGTSVDSRMRGVEASRRARPVIPAARETGVTGRPTERASTQPDRTGVVLGTPDGQADPSKSRCASLMSTSWIVKGEVAPEN